MFRYRLTLLSATALLIVSPSVGIANTTVTVNNATVTPSSGVKNTQEAISDFASDANPSPYTILFDVNAGTVFQVGTTPSLINNTAQLTLGNESSAVTVRANTPGVSLLRGSTTLNLNLRKLSIEGFSSNDFGGTIFSSGMGGAPVSITGSTFTGNYVTEGFGNFAAGGAIFSSGMGGAPVSITGSTFTGNHIRPGAINYILAVGGAIYFSDQGSALSITGSTFTGNYVTGANSLNAGGAIYSDGQGSALSITGSTFTGNYVTGSGNVYGGAIFYDGQGAAISITGSIFTGNYASGGSNTRGGAIYSTGSSAAVFITDSTFNGNYASTAGGSVFIDPSSNAQNLTYNLTKDVQIDPVNQADFPNFNPAVHMGNNDIACMSTSGSNMVKTNAVNVTFQKTGPGRLTLNTKNKFWYGQTRVQEGTLLIGGTAAHSDAVWGGNYNNILSDGILTVESGAKFGGFGQTYVQDATFNSGSFYAVGLGQNGLSGTLNLNGGTPFSGSNAQITILPNSIVELGTQTYAIARAQGNLTSSPFIAPSNTAIRSFSLNFQVTDLQLAVTTSPFASAATVQPGTTAFSFASALDANFDNIDFTNNNSLISLNSLASLSNQDLPQALNQLCGQTLAMGTAVADQTLHHPIHSHKEITVEAPSLSVAQMQLVNQTFNARPMSFRQLSQQLDQRNHPKSALKATGLSEKSPLPLSLRHKVGPLSIWVEGTGQHASQGKQSDLPGVTAKLGGTTTGIDYQINPAAVIGATIGSNRMVYNVKASPDKGSINTFEATIYGFYAPQQNGFNANAGLSLGRHRFKSQRFVTIVADHLQQKHNGYNISGQGRLGYAVSLPQQTTIEPYLQGTLSRLHENGFTEKGLNPVKIKSANRTLLRWSTGAEWARVIVDEAIVWRPALQLGFTQRKALNNSADLKGELIGLTNQYTIKGDNRAHNFLSVGAEFTGLWTKEGISVTAAYNGDSNRKDRINEALLRMSFTL